MPNANTVILMGHLTRDPEVKQVGEHTVCNMGLAVNEGYKDKQYTSFIDIQAWNQSATYAEKYLSKGDALYVEGRIRQDRWESEGNQRSRVKVVANRIQGFPKQKPAQEDTYQYTHGSGGGADDGADDGADSEETPF